MGNIIDFMTYHIYDNVNRGLFGDDKLTFKLMCSLRICEIEQSSLTVPDIQTYLKCGTALTEEKKASCLRNPFREWLTPAMWVNVLALSLDMDLFADLPDLMSKNEKVWKNYFEDEEPEKLEIPLLAERLASMPPSRASFHKMCLVRALRDDRMTLVSKEFVTAVMWARYVQLLSVTMQEVCQ